MQEPVVSAAYLREQAAKCVRLASSSSDDLAAAALRKLAMEYEIEAERLERAQGGGPQDMPPPIVNG